MPLNKIVVNDVVKLDLTEDTVTPATLAKGVTAHDKTGAEIVGTMVAADAKGLIERTITDFDIPSNVTSIGDSAFAGCASLTHMTIPADVTSIGERAFAGCASLTNVYITSDTPCAIGNNAFDSHTIIYVPEGTVDIYKSDANWSQYADQIYDKSVEGAPLSVVWDEFAGPLTGTNELTANWSIRGIPQGCAVYTIAFAYEIAGTNTMNPAFTSTTVWSNEKHSEHRYTHAVNLAEKNVIRYRATVAVYANASDAVGDYIQIAEFVSPKLVCSGSSEYTIAPYDVQYPASVTLGQPINISWKRCTNAVYTGRWILQYSYNQRDLWYEVTTINDTSVQSWQYTVTNSSWTSIGFRVIATSTRNLYERSLPAYGEPGVVPVG